MKASKIKSNFIFEDVRFNASYFLNEDAMNSMKLESNRDRCVDLEEVADVWNPPIFKRQFCEKTEKSIPYCQSSDVTNQLEGSDVYIYKEQAVKVNSVVKENQILVTGFGTIGNTRLVNELSAGISYANNVCRIEPNEKLPFGFIYAFLTSKYGRSQLNKNASGSVVRYIEAPGIKKTLIPVLSAEIQQQIHQLIVEASELRVEANRLLNEAIIKIENEYSVNIPNKVLEFKTGVTSINNIISNNQNRLDSPVYITSTKDILKKKTFTTIKDLNFNVFRPGIFKRIKVNSNGIPYIKGSELNKLNPFQNCEYLSRKQTPFLDQLELKENQVLFTCAGTIGDLRMITKEYEEMKAIGSQDIIRIEQGKAKLSIFYLFAFLKTNFCNDYIQSLKYGSVIERVEPFHVQSIPIIIPEKRFEEEIAEQISKYNSNIYNSFNRENQAIELVEKKIDLWQVS